MTGARELISVTLNGVSLGVPERVYAARRFRMFGFEC